MHGSREVIDEYSGEVVRFCGSLMKLLSINLGLGEEVLQNAFGGDNIGACLRVNFYPKCPQPDLTLGLSSHSDPGGLTVLLPDQNVSGLQVRRGNSWITVKPARHAFIVNIGDQMQVIYYSLSLCSLLTASFESIYFIIYLRKKKHKENIYRGWDMYVKEK